MIKQLTLTVFFLALLLGLSGTQVSARSRTTHFWTEMPRIELEQELFLDNDLFPELTDGALLFVGFTEEKSWDGSQTGFATVLADQPVYLTVFYFSATGITSIPHWKLDLMPRHQVTASFRLPADDIGGMIQLVAWHREPAEEAVELLAVNPYGIGDPVPNVAALATFRRSAKSTEHHPWDDEFRLAGWNPAVDFGSAMPWLVVRVDDEGTICSKDCWVDFNGPVSIGFDDFGALGSMDLTGSSEIELNFEIPLDLRYSEAGLVIYGRDKGQAGSGLIRLESIVNNWSLPNSAPGTGPQYGMQHFFFEVSHYLKGGYNLIEIRQLASTSQQWAVERIELWID